MKCAKCGGPTVVNEWGNWCDVCGGVVIGDRLFFRHVATVDGAAGRFPIVYNLSGETYGVAWPRKNILVKCEHCGEMTSGEETRNGLWALDGFKKPSHYTKRGPLDVLLAFIQPIAKGDSEEHPRLSHSPYATEAEKAAILTGVM